MPWVSKPDGLRKYSHYNKQFLFTTPGADRFRRRGQMLTYATRVAQTLKTGQQKDTATTLSLSLPNIS
jgi:hypothetical protein